jgi:cell filamentation protein
MDRLPKPTGDLAELRAIHRHLFQDLYDWAGQIPVVDIRKNIAGAEFFLPSGMIERASVFAARELHSGNALRGLDRDHFIDRLAYHYNQVNYIHPFREGNGRVQRVFWNRIALAAGWQLDWRPVHGDVNDRASRAASDQRDLGPLRAMFDQIVTPAPPARNRGKSWREAERQRMSFSKPKPT